MNSEGSYDPSAAFYQSQLGKYLFLHAQHLYNPPFPSLRLRFILSNFQHKEELRYKQIRIRTRFGNEPKGTEMQSITCNLIVIFFQFSTPH